VSETYQTDLGDDFSTELAVDVFLQEHATRKYPEADQLVDYAATSA